MGVKLHDLLNDDRTHYGWLFWCPACLAVHELGPGASFNGDLENPTFTHAALVHAVPDIGRRRCHAFLTAGKVAFLPDSTHAMRGRTVDLPDWSRARHPLGGR